MTNKCIYFIFLFSILVFSCSQPPEIATAPPVEPTTPTSSQDAIIITSTSDSGPGTLRQALFDAQPGNKITFDPSIFPPDDPATIHVTSALPHIGVNNLTLDASNAGVILDGSQVPGGWEAGLQIVSSEKNTITGLQISNFSGPGIAISGGAKNNLIGGDRSIGSGPFGQGNLFSNNAVGVDMATSGTTLNTVTGNLIGTNAAGVEGLGNLRSGVLFWEGATGNIIGPDNIIAYNVECGIEVKGADSTSNTVSQNNIYDNGDIGTCLTEDIDTEMAETCPDCGADPLPDEQASIILHNGQILTMNADSPKAEAIAIKDGIIAAVGSNDEILALSGEDDEIIDLGGKALMPGFVDAHNHLLEAHTKNFAAEQDLILENGVTTIGILYATQEWIEELGVFNEKSGLKIRTNLYLTYSNACGEVYGDWYTQYPPTQDKSEMLRIAGVKVYADGGSCNAPAVSYEYPDGGQGDLYFTQDEMNQIVREINDNGYQAAIHALGDRAADQVLDAIERANAGNAIEMRNRIEHNTLISDDMLGRHDESGAVAIIFGKYPTCYFNGGTTTPEEIKHTEWRWKDLIDANPNTVFAWHSDVSTVVGPKALGIFVLNPFKSLYSFVIRRDFTEDGSVCEPQDWMKANTISVEEALPIMTINSAYALFMDDVIGSLEPGKFADMIILSENPLTVEPERLDDIEVLMTMVNGKTEFCAADSSEYCP